MTIQSIKHTLSKYFIDKPVLKAYIFGSIARQEDDINSDIDILVELDYSQTIGLMFVQMKLDLENIFHKKVDLLSQKAVSKYIKPYIDKDKILVYAK
ncbi:MAG: nucleotidyltransferase domain-containing protein [Bacteroidetes bacterium]|nr:nucleotidyltransferase domain-containing protein [Bacteroidota bacterium]